MTDMRVDLTKSILFLIIQHQCYTKPSLKIKKTSGIISNFTLSLRAEKCQSLQCKTRKQKSEKALCDK